MEIRARDEAVPFTTVDGSTIRSLLDLSVAPVQHQSLAEATIEAGTGTVRHHHRIAEEIYYLLEGEGTMELDGEVREVRAGDAILIPPGAWHQITASAAGAIRLLCCCSPPYQHGDTYFD